MHVNAHLSTVRAPTMMGTSLNGRPLLHACTGISSAGFRRQSRECPE